jgi:hypothetical protein
MNHKLMALFNSISALSALATSCPEGRLMASIGIFSTPFLIKSAILYALGGVSRPRTSLLNSLTVMEACNEGAVLQ